MFNRENQILNLNHQHAVDVEEIKRLREMLERLETDNETLRDWIKLNITLQDFALEPTFTAIMQEDSNDPGLASCPSFEPRVP